MWLILLVTLLYIYLPFLLRSYHSFDTGGFPQRNFKHPDLEKLLCAKRSLIKGGGGGERRKLIDSAQSEPGQAPLESVLPATAGPRSVSSWGGEKESGDLQIRQQTSASRAYLL